MTSFQGSDEGRWSFYSPKEVMSINSGVESQVSSSSNAPFEFLNTSESVDVAIDMSLPIGQEGHSPHQTCLPHPADITEWVQRQYVNTNTPLQTRANDHELPGTASKISASKSEVSRAPTESLGQCSKIPRHPSSVYDISTLLAIGARTPSDQMELRIRPAALAEDVFKYKSSTGSLKSFEKLRHRVQSEDSDVTHRSIKSDDEVVFSQNPLYYARPPFRQPLAPPEKTSAQQHEGFKRFLKQVASPPHQRVTAGGRVVPAGPQPPPPMMNFSSIDATLSRPLAAKHPAGQIIHPGISKKQSRPIDSSGEDVPDYSRYPKSLDQSVPVPRNPNDWDRSGPMNGHMSTILPAPAGMIPVLFLPAGDAVVFCNGVYSRIYHNGHDLVPEPLPINPSMITSLEHLATVCSQIPRNINAVPLFVGPNPRAGVSAMPSLQLSGQISNDALYKTYEKLRSHLSKVDRYMASKFDKLSQLDLKILAAQREQLVEQIDFLRVKLASPGLHPSQNPGISQHVPFIASPLPPRPYSSNEQESGHATNYAPESTQTALLATGQTSCLSPSAPPFIPSSIKALSDGSNSQHKWGITKKHETRYRELFPFRDNAVSNHLTPQATTALGNLETAMSSKVVDQPLVSLENSVDDSAVAANSSSILTQEDVEYVDHMGLNLPDGKKLFCSTIEEFQEVIRQVREQARIYGCKGGQSKDPAYDAEEDVRWAMKDNVPIPLPAMVPDHVLRPRPWSWADSLFNPCNHADLNYGISCCKVSISEPQEPICEEVIDPGSHLAIATGEGIPKNDPSWGQTAGEIAVGLTRGGDHKMKLDADARPLAWALKAFGFNAAMDAFKTSPSGKTSNLPLGSLNIKTNEPQNTNPSIVTVNSSENSKLTQDIDQDDKEFIKYINDEFDHQFSDGGRYTLKYDEVLLPFRNQDPHFERMIQLLNPVQDPLTNELIFAHDGPPGYEQDMARYAEKYGEQEAKRRLNGLSPYQNLHDLTEDGKPLFNIPLVRSPTPTEGIYGCEMSPKTVVPTAFSKENSAYQPCSAMSNETKSLSDKILDPILKSRPAYQPAEVSSQKGKLTSQTSSVKPNETSNFLKGMLKSPRFSIPKKKFRYWTTEEVRQFQMKIQGIDEEYSENSNGMKENLGSYSQANENVATSPTIRSSVPLVASQDVRLQKAQSSLASSNYNVPGYLPPYKSADAYLEFQIPRNYPQHGASRSHSSRPRGAPYSNKRDGLANHRPESHDMGLYDGAYDSPVDSELARDNDNKNSTAKLLKSQEFPAEDLESTTNGHMGQTRPQFDYKGVTTANFNTCGRVFAPGHKAATDHFFNKLREQEAEVTRREQAVKPKTSQSSSVIDSGRGKDSIKPPY